MNITSRVKNCYPLLLLLVLALATRFLFLWYPAQVVFDEVHFGKFVSAYFSQQYYFDIHPPLGKLMIAGLAHLTGVRPDAAFVKIGEAVSSRELFILRFLPGLFGCLLPLVFYGIVLALGGSGKTAFLAGLLAVFENAFLVESKFLLVDSFLFFFGFLSILVFLLSRKQEDRLKKYLLYFASMVFASLAFSIKWTGLSFLGIILFFSFISSLKNFSLKRFLKFLAEVFISLLLFVFVYSLPFVVHFKLLNLSGPGDPYMSQEFQQTLIGNMVSKEVKPMPFWQKLIELNQKMFFYNSTLKIGHQDASRFYEWPLDRKPVWYWNGHEDVLFGDIYLFGNPLVFWPAALAVCWGIISFARKRNWTIAFLLFGYFINLLPFIFIGRAAFLYHYLPSLGFAILLLALFLDRFWATKQLFPYGYLLLVYIGFLLLFPITYGYLLPVNIAAAYRFLVNLFH